MCRADGSSLCAWQFVGANPVKEIPPDSMSTLCLQICYAWRGRLRHELEGLRTGSQTAEVSQRRNPRPASSRSPFTCLVVGMFGDAMTVKVSKSVTKQYISVESPWCLGAQLEAWLRPCVCRCKCLITARSHY